MSAPRRIVLAVDESEECERALSWLREHLYKPGDEVHLVHVLPYQPQQLDPEEQAGAPPVDFLPVEAPPPPEERDARAKAFLKSNFLDRTQQLRPPLVPHVISSKSVTDTVGGIVVRTADELGASAIVVASKTHTRLQVSRQSFQWEDGEKVCKMLDTLDRWEVQGAESVHLEALGVLLQFRQNQRLLSAGEAGVGAVLWESALVLAAHLVQQPLHRYVGARVVELGAGLGLVGLLLAKLGAQVVLTDLDQVVPLLQASLEANDLARHRPTAGNAEAMTLDWGAVDRENTVEGFRQRNLDLVVAADCCYDDQVGSTPDPNQFFTVCRQLCNAKTSCLIAVERRRETTYDSFIACAQRHFLKVRQLPHPAVPLVADSRHVELWSLSIE